MLLANHQISLKLNSEHGKFVYLVKQGAVPQLNEEGSFEAKNGQWIGYEYKNIEIKAKDLDTKDIEKSANLPSR